MRVGCCTKLSNNISILQDAGFDFYELNTTTLLPLSDDDEFIKIEKQVAVYKIRPETYNCLLPPNLKVVGLNTDFNLLEKYIISAVNRMSTLGGKLAVFGSAGARTIPPGFDYKTAISQITDFVTMMLSYADKFSLEVVIEPLNRKETNVFTTLKEVLEYMNNSLPNSKVNALVDFYHFMQENEKVDTIVSAGKRLKHVHINDSDRTYPGNGNFPYPEFFKSLKQIGYDNRLSIESRWNDFKSEAPVALNFVKNTWNSIQI